MTLSEFLATFGTLEPHLPSGFATGFAVLAGLAWFRFLHKIYPRVGWIVAVLLASATLVVTDAAESAPGADDSQIILDEFVAVPFLFLFYVPWRHPHALLSVVGTLIVFGTLDSLKPFGLQVIERLPGGFGVVLDDIGAAVLSSAVVWLAYNFMLELTVKREVKDEGCDCHR